MITLSFPIKPVPKGRPRMSRWRHCYTPDATAKFEKEIKNTKRLKEVSEELIVTDNMDQDRALQYAKDHFNSVAHRNEAKVSNN